jgi:hypothetical protein
MTFPPIGQPVPPVINIEAENTQEAQNISQALRRYVALAPFNMARETTEPVPPAIQQVMTNLVQVFKNQGIDLIARYNTNPDNGPANTIFITDSRFRTSEYNPHLRPILQALPDTPELTPDRDIYWEFRYQGQPVMIHLVGGLNVAEFEVDGHPVHVIVKTTG